MKQKNVKQLWKKRLSMGLSLAMAVTMLPAGSLTASAEEGDAPAILKAGYTAGTATTKTYNQPFVRNVTGGTGGTASDGRPYFSSPALAVKETLALRESGECVYYDASNTTLIAVAEGKFNQNRMAGGTDIVASVSTDGGSTWTYSYPLRFPDSAGDAGKYATSINNPAITVADDGTIYCLMNVTPSGVSSLASEDDGFIFPKQGTGYIEIAGKQRLALCSGTDTPNTAPDGYAYYVGDWESSGYAKVLNKDGNTATKYAVDKWYNLYEEENGQYKPMKQNRATSTGYNNSSEEVQQNVFYYASRLHVYNTSYIVCVTSRDGLSWTAPEILNPEVKRADGYSLAVSGGKGLRTSQNRLVFPVYRRDDPKDTGNKLNGKASVIWLDKSTGGDNKWHRSEDVPEFTSEDSEEGDGDANWIGDGEIAEISDGKLRFVFSNGRGRICYADAERDDKNAFVFSEPVSTGTVSPAGSNPSVISYLNPIDEKKGMLVASPVGSNQAENGTILTFLPRSTDTEEADLAGNMERAEEFSVPGGSSYFRSACLDQMNAGSNIGLVWESGTGSVSFKKFGITEIIKERYIPHITVDIDLEEGTTYERKYSVVGAAHISGMTEPTEDAKEVVTAEFTAKAPTTESVPALYAHKTKNADSNLSAAYMTEPDGVDRTLEKAEFTITRPDNTKPNEYVVYSDLLKRYFVLGDAKDMVSASRPAYNIVITKDPASYEGSKANNSDVPEGTFAIMRADGSNWKKLLFSTVNLRTDSWNDWTNATLKASFTFLQKMEPDEKLTGDDAKLELITGYKKVAEITPNKKYLIAFELPDTVAKGDSFNDESIKPIVIIYPRNTTDKNQWGGNGVGKCESVKLVYGTREVQRRSVRELRVTAKKEGDAEITADHVTYRFHCYGSTITMKKGERRFFPGVTADGCTVTDTNVAAVENFTQETPSLADCERTAKDSLDGYSKTPNTDVNMSGAEFIFTSVGDSADEIYTIQSVLNGKYLLNDSGAVFFGQNPTNHEVKRPEGELGFEIMRKKDDRYIFFYYTLMQYDATSNKDFIASDRGDTKPLKERGNFTFELLEKQDYPSDADQIEGYKRVSSITSGKHYLITQVYNDAVLGEGRIVLYPGTNLQTWSKLYRDLETPGVQLTAVGSAGSRTAVTINGREYTIAIDGECPHTGYGRYLVNAKERSCEEEGYTGDEYCSNCHTKISDGQVIPAGHDVPVWNTTKEPTFEADGEKSGICSICKETVKEAYLKADFVKEEFDKKVLEARGKREADYTAKSYAILAALLDEAPNADTTDKKIDLYNRLDAAITGLEKKTDFNAAKNKVSAKLLQIKAALAKNESEFEAATWQGLQAAVDALKAADIGIDLDALADEAAINAKLETLTLTALNKADEAIKNVSTATKAEAEEQAKCEQLKADLNDLLDEVDGILAEGQGDYTDESWQKLEDAFDAADLTNTQLNALDSTGLQELLDGLNAAKDGLVKKETDTGLTEAKGEVAKAVQAADAVAAGGQKNYTKESWDAFIAAYNAAKNAPANADAATLKKLAENLANAQKALTAAAAPAPTDTLQKGYTEDVNGIRYEVLDPVKLTVKAKLGLNKKAGSINIPAAVTIKGNVTCNVVQVGDKAFSGYKKATKITIGANVTTIGKQAFASCKKLKKLTLKGKALKSIKSKAFKGATKKKVQVKWPKGIKKAQKKKLINGFKKAGIKVK